jgi:hypothetical protein
MPSFGPVRRLRVPPIPDPIGGHVRLHETLCNVQWPSGRSGLSVHQSGFDARRFGADTRWIAPRDRCGLVVPPTHDRTDGRWAIEPIPRGGASLRSDTPVITREKRPTVNDNLPDFSNAAWRKSKRSAMGNCVEIAEVDGWIGVRDSKAPRAGNLQFQLRPWGRFLAGLKAGELGRPVRR